MKIILLAGHSLELQDQVLFSDTKRLVHESLEIHLEDNALNRDNGLRLSSEWLPTLKLIKAQGGN